MTILLLRASYANEFELQNYAPLAENHDIRVVTSQHPLTDISLPTIRLWSPTDLPQFPLRRQLLNRTIGGEQWLSNLGKLCYHVLEHGNKTSGLILHTAETYTPYTHQAVQLRKVGKVSKLVVTCWETIPHNNEKFARLRRWKQEAYQYVDFFHTPTQRAKDALITEGVPASKIRVIPYGVDLTRFQPKTRKSHSRLLVLTVARLEVEKGMKELEESARQHPEADFLVVGQGSYRFQASNVTTRRVPYSKIHRIYQRADIFYLPSQSTATWEEQYGMAIVEAMACGLPIVTTDSGAISEVMGDLPAPTLSELLKSSKLRKQLSNQSRARALTHFDASKQAHKLATLYPH